MSRLCFSNNIEIVNKFISYNEKAGFTDYNTLTFNGVSGGGAVFKKLKIKNENSLTTELGSICVVGTFFYNGVGGKNALMGVLSDFDGDVSSVRRNMNGAFACVILKDDTLYAFGDSTGVYYYYYSYFEETKEWIIGTSLYGLVKASGHCSLDEFNVLERCFQGCALGEGTFFKDFYKIDGDCCIVVNLKGNTIDKRNIGNKITIDSRDIDVV